MLHALSSRVQRRGAGRWASTRESRLLPLVEAGVETPVWVQGHEGRLVVVARGATALCSWFHRSTKAPWSRCNGETFARGGLRGLEVTQQGGRGITAHTLWLPTVAISGFRLRAGRLKNRCACPRMEDADPHRSACADYLSEETRYGLVPDSTRRSISTSCQSGEFVRGWTLVLRRALPALSIWR